MRYRWGQLNSCGPTVRRELGGWAGGRVREGGGRGGRKEVGGGGGHIKCLRCLHDKRGRDGMGMGVADIYTAGSYDDRRGFKTQFQAVIPYLCTVHNIGN